MPTGLDQIAQTLREVFPVRENLVELCLADAELASAAPDGRVTFRMVVWDKAENGDLTIRDVKEQELFLFDPALIVGDVPVLAYLRGWSMALRQVLAGTKVPFETLMPHDFLDVGVLKLRKATTPEDYRNAFLAKGRLGKYLG